MGSKSPHYEGKTIIQWTGQTTELQILPRDLRIVWGNDTRYWHIPDPDNKNCPAELLQVNWLEVTRFASLVPGKTYEIGFTVSLSEDAFGWSNVPVYIMAKLGKRGNYVRKKVSLINNIADNNSSNSSFDIPGSYDKLIIEIPSNSMEATVYFGLYEVWSGRWKGGLQIHSAFIREFVG